MSPETLDEVKLFIRICHSKLDSSIKSDIDSCLGDLQVHGITYKDDTDPLILNAIKLWCKAIYIDDEVKAAEYLKRYYALRDCLKSAEGYGWEAVGDE